MPILLLGALLLPLLQDPDKLTGAIDGAVVDATRDATFVGLSVAVAKDDVVVFARGYGLAEAEHGVAADEDTMFRIGSITKQFTAAAVCRLVERFELDLDENLDTYDVAFPVQGRSVTLRHLLTHTSGIPSYTDFEAWRRTGPLELTHEELLGQVRDKPFQFEPGTAFNYNNTGYYLLGVVLERVTGDTYSDHLHGTLFGPLGLARTRYDSNADLIPNRAQGYRMVDGRLANDEPIGLSQPGAAGALASTARDLVAWDVALRTGKVVEPATYAEMTTPYMLANATEVPYGLGLFLNDRNGARCVSHGGGIHGFNSILAHYPDAGISIAVLSNCENFSAEAVEASLAALLLAGEK